MGNLRKAATDTALPVHLQQRKCLWTAGTAGQCQLPTFGKTRAFTDFALFNYLIRAGAAVAGYADPEAAGFPVKLAAGDIGAD
jgi:hypothetical protein